MALREVIDYRAEQLFRRSGVAEHAVLDAPRECRAHRRRRAEIRIGDPERDHVAPRVALPSHAPGAGPLDRLVEICFFGGFDSSSFSRLFGSFCCSWSCWYVSSSSLFMLSSTS